MRRPPCRRVRCSACSSSTSAMRTVVRCRSWRRLAVVFLLAAAAIAVTEGRPTSSSAAVLPDMRRTERRWSALLLRSTSAAVIRGSAPVVAEAAAVSRRRQLVGPGSSPPTCRARCGRCAPCRAVRVAIQPGIGTQWEYYPEVWRCKCGSKLFMP